MFWYSKNKYTFIPAHIVKMHQKNNSPIIFLRWKKNYLTGKKIILGLEVEGRNLSEYSLITQGKPKSDIPNQILVNNQLKQIKIIFNYGTKK